MAAKQTYTLGDVTSVMAAVLKETFEKVEGMYLDQGTSFFETLATVDAAEASRPVTPGGSNIAAQVNHTTYYIVTIGEFIQGRDPAGVDWDGSWHVGSVTEAEWKDLTTDLGTAYDRLLMLLADPLAWTGDDALTDGIALVAHCAYHLGEVRRSLGVLRA